MRVALLWNRNERELLGSHGFSQNQLTLYREVSINGENGKAYWSHIPSPFHGLGTNI